MTWTLLLFSGVASTEEIIEMKETVMIAMIQEIEG